MQGSDQDTQNLAAHRIELAREADFVLGAAQVSPAAREIMIAGRRRILQPRIMQVLVRLARNKGKVISRDQLVESCWGGLNVSEDAVQRSIARLRRLADESVEAPFRIDTIARVGYRLVEQAADSCASASPHAASERPSAIPIAVLPFVNLSPDPEQEYFSDGLSEELMSRLARAPGLRVAARTSSFIFKGQSVDVKQIGEKLGVTHVVEGSVRKSGQRLRINAQLADSTEGYCLWSRTYDRQLEDVFAIYDEITDAVATALHIALGVAAPPIPGGTTNFVAYDLYLRAKALFREGGPDPLQRAIQIFREALVLDPHFASVWTGLAEALTAALVQSPNARDVIMPELEEAFERASEIAPELWEIHFLKGIQLRLQRDWLGAEEAYRKALALAPTTPGWDTCTYGSFLAEVGRIKEAVAYFNGALRTNPLSPGLSLSLQFTYHLMRSPAAEEREYERSKELPLDRAVPEFWQLVRVWDKKDVALVRTQFKRFLAVEAVKLPVHQDLLMVFDKPEKALALVRQAVSDPGYQDSLRQTILSYWAAHYGDNELALAALHRSLVDLNSPQHVQLWIPLFRQLRRDPRFKEIVRKVGLYDYWRESGQWGDCVRPKGEDDFEFVN